MIEVFETSVDGFVTQEHLYWDFIKTMELTKEYKLWHQAIVEKEFEVLE